jgi:hypothetical protein
MIQKGGNYMFLHTYTFTIDIVPLVLEVHYFTGIILEYKGIIVKYAINQSTKQKNEKKAHPNIKFGPTTNEKVAQAHLETDQRKAVTRRLHLGVAAPLPLPTRPTLLWWYHQCARRSVWDVS